MESSTGGWVTSGLVFLKIGDSSSVDIHLPIASQLDMGPHETTPSILGVLAGLIL